MNKLDVLPLGLHRLKTRTSHRRRGQPHTYIHCHGLPCPLLGTDLPRHWRYIGGAVGAWVGCISCGPALCARDCAGEGEGGPLQNGAPSA